MALLCLAKIPQPRHQQTQRQKTRPKLYYVTSIMASEEAEAILAVAVSKVTVATVTVIMAA